MLVISDGIFFLQFLMPFLNKGACYVSAFPLARQMAKREGLIDFNRTYRWREYDANSPEMCSEII